MARVLIIGFGNPLRGDDGLGWHAVEQLRPTLANEDAETLACLQLTPELAEAVAQSERVIFIDAALREPPGEVNVARLDPVWSSAPPCSHVLTPRELMQYSSRLYGSRPEAFVISANAARCEYSEALSVQVQYSLPAVVRAAHRLARGVRADPEKASASA